MPLTPDTVTREDAVSGDSFRVYDTGSGALAQGVVLVDDAGAHVGITGNPLPVEFATAQAVTVSGTVTTTATVANAASSPVPVRLYTGSSTEVGTATNQIGVTLFNSSDAELGTVASPVPVRLYTGSSTEVGTATNQIGVTLFNSSDAELGGNTTPIVVSERNVALTNFVTAETAVFSVANVGTGACTLYELDCILAVGSTTDYTVMLFDSTSVPEDNTDPFRRYLIPSEGMIHLEWPKGLRFATGLSLCFSTTRDDKTIATAVSGSAGGWFQGLFGT